MHDISYIYDLLRTRHFFFYLSLIPLSHNHHHLHLRCSPPMHPELNPFPTTPTYNLPPSIQRNAPRQHARHAARTNFSFITSLHYKLATCNNQSIMVRPITIFFLFSNFDASFSVFDSANGDMVESDYFRYLGSRISASMAKKTKEMSIARSTI